MLLNIYSFILNLLFMFKNNSIIFLIIQLFFSYSTSSQEALSGTVLEINTNRPLSNTHVYIENTSLGTVTNDDGVFKLSIPKEYQNGKIVFSLLGFETKRKDIMSLLVQSDISIVLSSNTEILDEVIISATKINLDGVTIVKKAFENYTENFPEEPYLAKGFARHTERTDKEYKWMTEVAFEMYDTGRKNNIDINIIESRKSIDYREFDTVPRLRAYLKDVTNNGFRKRNKKTRNYKENFDDKFIVKAFAHYDNHFTAGYNKKMGLIKKILSWNKIRNYNQKNAIFTEKNLEKIKFEKDTVLGYEEEKIYKVKFSIPYKDYPRLDIGWLYIRAKDYAIIEMDCSLILSKADHYRKATGLKVHHTTNIKYKEFNNKMYPAYVSYKSFELSRLPSSFKNGGLLDGTYSHDEILFSEIITNKEQIRRASKTLEAWDGNMFSKRAYNPIFWDDYNILIHSKEQQKLISDLEKKVSLKNQFEQE